MTSILLDPRRTVVFAGDAATLAGDGVHPTAAGHRAIADLWRRIVLED